MRALFFALPVHGHINPALPLIRELVSRGDAIICYTTEPFAAKVAEAGAGVEAYRAASLDGVRHLPERIDQLSSWLMRLSADVLEAALDRCCAQRPDYVMTDSVAPWGRWIAEILDVPVVTSITTFAFNRHVVRYAGARGVRPESAGRVLTKIAALLDASRVNRVLRRRYRVRGPGVIGSVIGHSDLNIVYTSREFQPRADTFDERYVFVGPSMAPRAEDATLPEMTAGLPLVYVSLGTLFNDDVSFYRQCLDGLANEPVQVLLSIGTKVDADAIGRLPSNAVVCKYVPQIEVLQRAAAFVTHGGMNSVSESLYYGVPMAVVPRMGEQAIVGRRVEELGAGVYVAKDQATPDRIGGAVRQLLREDRFRARAAALGESFRAAGGVSRAADAIFAFTR